MEARITPRALIVAFLAGAVAAIGTLAASPPASATGGETYLGNTFNYTLIDSNTHARLDGCSTCSGDFNLALPPTLGGVPVTEIGANAFSGQGLTGAFTIPESVTAIGDEAFRTNNCEVTIGISSALTSIGASAFRDNPNAGTNLQLSENLVSVGADAFRNAGVTGRVYVYSSTTTIGSGAFADNPGVTSFAFGGVMPTGLAGAGAFTTTGSGDFYRYSTQSSWNGTTTLDGHTVVAASFVVYSYTDQIATVGDNITFTPTLIGGTEVAVSYSWYKDNILISGQTAPTLTRTNVQPADSGRYKLQIANVLGASTVQFDFTVNAAPSSPASTAPVTTAGTSSTSAAPPTLRVGSKRTVASLLAAQGKLPKGYKVSKVSAKAPKICTVSGLSVRGVKVGTCRAGVTLKASSKKTKPASRGTTLSIAVRK